MIAHSFSRLACRGGGQGAACAPAGHRHVRVVWSPALSRSALVQLASVLPPPCISRALPPPPRGTSGEGRWVDPPTHLAEAKGPGAQREERGAGVEDVGGGDGEGELCGGRASGQVDGGVACVAGMRAK